MKGILDTGLTHEEEMIIGDIVAQWGTLEAEIFIQTLESFGSDLHVSQLPRAMRNRNFSDVLDLWKVRVVETSEDAVKKVFEEAYEKILKLKDVRHSIVHGMWDFSVSEPKTISTFRVKDDRIIHTTFEDGALADVGMKIAELNMSIRYPGGLADYFKEQMGDGVYVNHAEMRRMKLKLDREKDGDA
ncbi:MAG: hypothetical protein KJ946_06775 [Gammaproteobacteria bacterium]|nr:hypothetical protein [Gammaproteobacteria bacterium]OZA11876.1 MAG: hypothetical protein B7X94_04660 [Hydrogenophilales bacterium 17-62-8]